MLIKLSYNFHNNEPCHYFHTYNLIITQLFSPLSWTLYLILSPPSPPLFKKAFITSLRGHQSISPFPYQYLLFLTLKSRLQVAIYYYISMT